MVWITVDKKGLVSIFDVKPIREKEEWVCIGGNVNYISKDREITQALVGRKLTWEDEPVGIKESDSEIVFKGNGDSTEDAAIAFHQLCEDIIKFGEMGQSYWNLSLRGNKKALRSRAKQIAMRARILQEIVNSYTED